MEWKKTLSRGLLGFHLLMLVAVLGGAGLTIYSLRLADYHRTEDARVLKLGQLLKELKENEPFERVAKHLARAQADKAHERMQELSRQIAELEGLLETKASAELRESLRSFSQHIGQASGISNPEDALRLLSRKANDLHAFARARGYKTVTTVSEGIKQRLAGLSARNVGESAQVGFISSELKKLDAVVTRSTLSEAEKKELLARFNSLRQELALLGGLTTQARSMQGTVTRASEALVEWLDSIEARAQDVRELKLRKQARLVTLLAGFTALLVFCWLGISGFFRWVSLRISRDVESEVRNVIKNGVMADERFRFDHYSAETRDEIVHLLDQLKVKLNLGSLLHEGMPFAGCMFDQDLRLSWFNNLFLEQFYLSEEEARSEDFNWHQLRRAFGIDHDPIEAAATEKIAGIYPVRIRQDEFTPAQPYEMYVTPLMVNREERVMLFFYPLVSAKDAIREQVTLARDVILRFFELWEKDELSDDELRLLRHDFEANELGTFFNFLISFQRALAAEKAEYIKTVSGLERSQLRLQEALGKIREHELKHRETIRGEVTQLHRLKASFLTTIERCETLQGLGKSLLQQYDEVRNDAQRLQQQSAGVLKTGRETTELLKQFAGIKLDLKNARFELLEVRGRLLAIHQSLKSGNLYQPQAEEKLPRLEEEFNRFERALQQLDRKTTASDILVSKLQMMHETHDVPQTQFSFQATQRDREIEELLQDSQRLLSSEEGKMLEAFQRLDELIQEDSDRQQEIAATSAVPTAAPLS
jgi:hypothetical protein